MKNLSPQDCKDINDHPFDFGLYLDLTLVAAAALNGKTKVICRKFIQSKEQPWGIPDTPESEAWFAVFREYHGRFGVAKDGSWPCAKAAPRRDRRLPACCREAGKMTDRFMGRYQGVYKTYLAGGLKDMYKSRKKSAMVELPLEVHFAAAVTPLRRDGTFQRRPYLTAIRGCLAGIKKADQEAGA